MSGTSLLFPNGRPTAADASSEVMADLRLDDVFERVAASRAEYDIAAVLHAPLPRASDVRFRQDVFRDIDAAGLRPIIDEFAEGMRGTRRLLVGLEQLRSRRQQQGWFVDAAERYCRAVDTLVADLDGVELASAGLGAVRDHLRSAVHQARHATLRDDTRRVLDGLHAVRYCETVDGNRVIVTPDAGEGDYSDTVLATFERFRQRDTVAKPRERQRSSAYMNHVDAAVLDLVARLYPEPFAALDEFCDVHRGFIDDGVALFDQEIQFFTAIDDLYVPLRAAGLPTCLPDVVDDDRSLDGRDVYDVALATKLVADRRPVVLNDVRLAGDERIIVVTGPNQGGKTTFARTFGQLHHLAALGGPVPGRAVRLGTFDRIFTHFERTEDMRSLTGKLEDELVRIRGIVERITHRSIVVMNESFGSTSLRDARLLGATILDQLIIVGVRALYVTFVDELSRLDPTIVSMVSTVEPDDPAQRTFRIVRRVADGRAYAMSLAERHGLTARQLTARIAA